MDTHFDPNGHAIITRATHHLPAQEQQHLRGTLDSLTTFQAALATIHQQAQDDARSLAAYGDHPTAEQQVHTLGLLTSDLIDALHNLPTILHTATRLANAAYDATSQHHKRNT